MSVNSSWPKWIWASVVKHFKASLASYNVFVEGQDRATNTFEDWIEIRMDGPWFEEIAKDQWKVVIEINILISSVIRENNFYTLKDLEGAVLAAFTNSIAILKLGPLAGDDGTQAGCLQIYTDFRRMLQDNQYGQIDVTQKLLQSTIECRYFAFL
jgi:hypothetical protein